MRKLKNKCGAGHAEICPQCGQMRTANKYKAMLDQLPLSGYIRQRLLVELVPISKSKLWRDCQRGAFPKPVKLSERVTGWRISDVRKWMIERGLIPPDDGAQV